MDESGVPYSVGIIMDGNRRWARENNLPQLEGHRRGYDKVKDLVRWAEDAGVKEVVLYAFSTENWNRSKEEVEYLLRIFDNAFTKELHEITERGWRIRFIGQRERFSPSLQKKMSDTEEDKRSGETGTLAIALSYGGRPEILAAVNKLIEEGKKNVDETMLREAMWSAGLADPDLIIRTSGEQRLSNFLTWQSVYSELFFTPTKWPAFTKEEFDSIIAEFAARHRRHGK